jgi:PTH1 family peptidyl-tRNA hydrolase
MWLLAGLGNPEDEYAETRHNIGFEVIDVLSARHAVPVKKKTANFIYGRGLLKNLEVLLIKPLTYMNRSGVAVWDAVRKYEGVEDLIIIHDDLDLEPGVVRVREKGSSGGHNGVQSVIDSLGSQEFTRVKIGIGRPARGSAEKYVLRKFSREERVLLNEAVETAADAVEEILSRGVKSAQNRFH